MGNYKSIFTTNKTKNINTEGSQGMITVNSDKEKKKTTLEIIYKEKDKNQNLFSRRETRRETVDVLLTKDKDINKNINTIPTENNINFINNYNKLNNHITNNNTNTIEPNQKEEIKINNNNNSNTNIKKMEFNNITIVDNLGKYFPKNITKEDINEMVRASLDGYIVEDQSKYIPGKNITNEQVDLLGQYIYENINKNKINNKNDYSIIEDINVKVGMYKLNKEIIEKTFFKGKKISKIQSDIIIKSLTKGRKDVKALYIELL